MPKIDETEPENGIIKEFQDKTKLFRLNRLLSDRRVVLCLALALPVVILLTGNYLYNICVVQKVNKTTNTHAIPDPLQALHILWMQVFAHGSASANIPV